MEDFLTVYKDFENTIRKETSFVTAKDYNESCEKPTPLGVGWIAQ